MGGGGLSEDGEDCMGGRKCLCEGSERKGVMVQTAARITYAGPSFQGLGMGSCALEERKSRRQKICNGGFHCPSSYSDPKETTCSLLAE